MKTIEGFDGLAFPGSPKDYAAALKCDHGVFEKAKLRNQAQIQAFVLGKRSKLPKVLVQREESNIRAWKQESNQLGDVGRMTLSFVCRRQIKLYGYMK